MESSIDPAKNPRVSDCVSSAMVRPSKVRRGAGTPPRSGNRARARAERLGSDTRTVDRLCIFGTPRNVVLGAHAPKSRLHKSLCARMDLRVGWERHTGFHDRSCIPRPEGVILRERLRATRSRTNGWTRPKDLLRVSGGQMKCAEAGLALG